MCYEGSSQNSGPVELCSVLVVKAPKEGGSIYSIAPLGELSKMKHVHHSLLKLRNLKVHLLQSPQCVPSAQRVLSQEEKVDEVDWLVVISGEHKLLWNPQLRMQERGEDCGMSSA